MKDDVTMSGYPYVWRWRWRWVGPPRRPVSWFGDGVDRAGHRCRVIARSTALGSAWIEFQDGYQTNTSRRGLARAGQRLVGHGEPY